MRPHYDRWWNVVPNRERNLGEKNRKRTEIPAPEKWGGFDGAKLMYILGRQENW